MINHARTLLLNRTADQLACDWDEYVPADFKPIQLSGAMQSIYEVMYGSSPDSWKLNWRISQFLTLMHASDFSDHVTALDSRISYVVPPRTITDAVPLSTSKANASNSGTATFTFGGTPVESVSGKMLSVFRLLHSGGFNFEITDETRGAVTNETFVVGTPVSLGSSGVTISINGTPAAGDRWIIESIAPPAKDLADVLAGLRRISLNVRNSLFGSANAEPYKSLYYLWSDSRGMAEQLTAVLLAWVYTMDGLLNG